ncbi:DNA/RNA helicase domain-containing protein [Clostridium sp.]|uniref:DNA/RNA helicase domain-containing protein n=1 Tax=Clostridium sp. TaxID=1506 RepID=UPI003D6D656E
MSPFIISLDKFLRIDKLSFIEHLTNYIVSYELPLGELQISAWEDCYYFLQEQLFKLQGEFNDAYMIFEYMLPLEKYRRPDVILLFKEKVIILEFKQKDKVELKDIEQAIGYREDIKHFHYATSKYDMEVETFLVVTKLQHETKVHRGVKVLNSKNFIEEVFDEDYDYLDEAQVNEWVNSKYEPIPSIIEATNQLFFHGELPYIKNIAQGDIDVTVKKVAKLIGENEKTDKKKRIIFVSGVPGSGKTLVALQTLYDYNKKKFEKENVPFGAVYLSGNGPLVSVLKEQLSTGDLNVLEGKAYIKGMLEYKKEYLNNSKVPDNTVLLFDEAQRAWDKKQMKKNLSEPEGLLQIGEKIYKDKGYVTIVCFIGDGQSIYKGEEKGLVLWEEALKEYNDWEVYIPSKYEEEFNFLIRDNIDNDLFLDTSIRSNFIDTSKWIESLLKLETKECKEYLKDMQEKGLILRLTREMQKAKEFAESFAIEYPKSKYGLLISSKCRRTEKNITILTNGYFKGSYIKQTDAGKWFMQDSTKLSLAASEFLCQGLEIDLPIVIFGGDYYIKNNEWYLTKAMENDNKGIYEDYNKIIENTYRVLLSRARKGMILFIPSSNGFNETYEYFKELGIDEI